jgi:hypothetical protein
LIAVSITEINGAAARGVAAPKATAVPPTVSARLAARA